MSNAAPFANWSPALRAELRARTDHAAVGTRLPLEDEVARHWVIHDLANAGDAELIFTTIEYLRCANAPLPLDDVRAAA